MSTNRSRIVSTKPTTIAPPKPKNTMMRKSVQKFSTIHTPSRDSMYCSTASRRTSTRRPMRTRFE